MAETPTTPTSPAATADRPPVDPAADVLANKDIAALGYVWILSVFVFFARKDSPFVRFHARQGIVLFVLSLLVWAVPFIGRYLELLILALAVIGFLNAAQGLWRELPLIGAVARRDKNAVRKDWRGVTDASVRGWKAASDLVKDVRPAPSAAAAEPAPAAPAQPTPDAAPATPSSTPTPPPVPPAA